MSPLRRNNNAFVDGGDDDDDDYYYSRLPLSSRGEGGCGRYDQHESENDFVLGYVF